MRNLHKLVPAAAVVVLAAAAMAGAGAPRASAVTAQLTTGSLAVGGAGGGRYLAVIRRTEYGIPHVLAYSYESLGYGYGYAFAQDNLCVMADRVVTLRGERSRYFGATAYSDDTLGPLTTNLDSDIYYRGIRDSGIVQRLLSHPAPLGPTAQARQLVAGYVAGYNRYLRDTGVTHLPDPTCRGKAWVTPITAVDVWSGIYDLDTLAGSMAYRTYIATASPPAASAVTSRPAVPAAAAAPVLTGEIGSNGWALGRDATRQHDGMLLANPHLPWTGDARLYEVQLTIPERVGCQLLRHAGDRDRPYRAPGLDRHRLTRAALHALPADPRARQPDQLPDRRPSRADDPPDGDGDRPRPRRDAVHRHQDPLQLAVRAGAGHRLDNHDRVRDP